MSNYRIGSGGPQKPLSTVPSIVNALPVGSSILVEMLTEQELTSSTIQIPGGKSVSAPQGYVLAVGPNLDPKAGIRAGQRILLQGTYVPVPNWDKNPRDRGIIEIHGVKAVLEEDGKEEVKDAPKEDTKDKPSDEGTLYVGPDVDELQGDGTVLV